MSCFFTRTCLLTRLLATSHFAFGQAASPRAAYPTAGRSDAWLDSVRRLPLPRQIVAVHQRMLRDTAYSSSPMGCRPLLGTVNSHSPQASIRLTVSDARPPGIVLLYVVNNYPAVGNTATAVADFWQHAVARPIQQITLLRGAAAAALYGSRAANGAVILSSEKP